MMRLWRWWQSKRNPHAPQLEYHVGTPNMVLARFRCLRCQVTSVEIIPDVLRGKWRGCTALPVPAQAPERDAASLPRVSEP